MRVFAIPHYYGRPSVEGGRRHGAYTDPADARAAKLSRLIESLHSLFGPSQCVMQLSDRRTLAANDALRDRVRVLVVTDGKHHLVDRLQVPLTLFEHICCEADPRHLGFAAQRVLADHSHTAEWLCYLEDDLLPHDAMGFWKLEHFLAVAGPEAVLMPQRFEVDSGAAACKAYVDGDLRPGATAAFQDLNVEPHMELPVLHQSVPLVRPANPHSGSFFLRGDQMRRWTARAGFGVPTSEWIGPLESAATLGIMRHFRIYKPARTHAGFFEIEHQSQQFIRQLRRETGR